MEGNPRMSITTRFIAAMILVAAFAPTNRAAKPKGGTVPENPLLGTWKQVTATRSTAG